MLKNGYHLTYCTNIHPGESWEETFDNLQKSVPRIKRVVSPDNSFGIGLRISDKASIALLEDDNLYKFTSWLSENDCYVFTLNGFPFGEFHHQVVKDQVHHPYWTTEARFDSTSRLCDILSALLPEGMVGGIYTSPLSYKYWDTVQQEKEMVLQKATLYMAKIAEKLYKINLQNKQVLHLDI
ncbi:MAG TPA: hypothetical protein VK921_10425, partial [Anditalea sp.]|nr:hypothetical protein [Anditalea sp.]